MNHVAKRGVNCTGTLPLQDSLMKVVIVYAVAMLTFYLFLLMCKPEPNVYIANTAKLLRKKLRIN
jgi:hypothetical protein